MIPYRDGDTHLQANKLVLTALLRRSEVEPRQSQWRADLIASMRVEEESHSTGAKVTVSIDVAISCVNLWISPQVADSLYVDDY